MDKRKGAFHECEVGETGVTNIECPFILRAAEVCEASEGMWLTNVHTAKVSYLLRSSFSTTYRNTNECLQSSPVLPKKGRGARNIHNVLSRWPRRSTEGTDFVVFVLSLCQRCPKRKAFKRGVDLWKKSRECCIVAVSSRARKRCIDSCS